MKKFRAKRMQNKRQRKILMNWRVTGKLFIVLMGITIFLLALPQCFPVRMKAAVTKVLFISPDEIEQEEAQGIPEGIGNKFNLQKYKKAEMLISSIATEIVQERDTLLMATEELILEKEEAKTKYASFSLTKEEIVILERIVEAEATGGSVDSKIHVAHVILNRCLSGGFPDDVESVVFEKNQFAPIKDGRYYTVEITDSTKEAVQMALTMDDTVDGAVYFALLKNVKNVKTRSWFDTLDFVFTDDLGHSFFRE